MKIQLKSDEDLTIVTKGGGNVIVPNNTDTSTDKTLATVDQIGPVGGDKANAASLAAPYETDHSSAYVVGDYVTHEGSLYKCKTDTSSPPGQWDDNKWDPVAVTDENVSKSGDTMTGALTTTALTVGSRVEGSTVGTNSVAEGHNTTASCDYSHAEGTSTTASGESSHAEGNSAVASGNSSHAEGAGTTASGFASHSEGENATASGNSSHAEGSGTTASDLYSHAEGASTTASGSYSHAEGAGTVASGSPSHAEGAGTTASGYASHSEGDDTTAQNDSEHAQGRYNKSTKTSNTFGTAGNTLHSVGFGTADDARKNAHEITQDGANFIYGVGGYNGTNATVGTNDLATVISNITSSIGDINSVLDAINGEVI